MEKRVAHYDLRKIKKLINEGNYYFTRIAKQNANNDFDLNEKEMIHSILDLKNQHLHKSMTSDKNNKLWQDVYHKTIINKTAYIKLQIVKEQSVIIQFKKK